MTARYSRRAALQLGGLSAAALTAAACGVQGAAKQQSTAQAESAADKFWKAQKPTGTVTFANWALYIDPDHQTLKDFTAKTGTVMIAAGQTSASRSPTTRSSRTTRASSRRSTRSSPPASPPATT